MSDEDILVVLVTRFHHLMKLDGILLSIRAMNLVNDQRVRLVVVGDGEAMDIVQETARQANEELGREAVVLPGAMIDPRPAYGAADIVLGMGGSALRGLANRKPVIVLGEGTFSRPFTPDTAEYFYENGMYGSDNDDPLGTRLAAYIASSLAPETRTRLGSFGLGVIRDRYSLDVLTSRLEGIYEQAIAQPRRDLRTVV